MMAVSCLFLFIIVVLVVLYRQQVRRFDDLTVKIIRKLNDSETNRKLLEERISELEKGIEDALYYEDVRMLPGYERGTEECWEEVEWEMEHMD